MASAFCTSVPQAAARCAPDVSSVSLRTPLIARPASLKSSESEVAGSRHFAARRPAVRFQANERFTVVAGVPAPRSAGPDQETPGGGAEPMAERGKNTTRTPPPDLPSLLLNDRIVYVGMPLVPAVTELIIAQLLFLQFEQPNKPVVMYINSTGSQNGGGEPVGAETEVFAICDTMGYVKPPVQTICIGQAYGTAAMLLACGVKGYRGALPNSTIMLHSARLGAQGQATDMVIRLREAMANKKLMVEILAERTGNSEEKVDADLGRRLYMTADEAAGYGIVDKVLKGKSRSRVSAQAQEIRDFAQVSASNKGLG
eukprot:tig00020952_g16507.t1